jgi:prenyltransferase beta subunit
VYLAFADHQAAGYTLHLRRSTNSGAAWSGDILTVVNATNPAVAINSSGKVAFLYQQATGTSPNQRWQTHIRTSPDGAAWDDTVLANTPADTPAPQFQPYLGDYVYLTANGADFYGIFCANNTPDNANFPNGVVYQRNANFTTHTLLGVNGTTPVAVSIDPFFFKFTSLQGRLWHTIRVASGSWQSFFGLIEGQEANDPGTFTAIGAAGVANELQMVGVGPAGQLWHTIRHPNGTWQGSFGWVEGQESNNPGAFTAVACAEVSGELHVVSVGPGGQLWHTIRHANGSWQGSFGWIEGQESNNPGVFTAVGCAGVNGELQVVGVGPGGQLWHTIRHANGSWQSAFGWIEGQESNNPGAFTAVACASVSNELQVIGVGPGGQLWHTIRHANGSWQGSFGLIEGQESNNPGAFTAIGCAGVNNEMQMIGVGPGGKLWHTIRHPNGSWQGSFGLVEGQESNDPGAFTAIACAGVGNEMQMVGIAPD